MVVEKQMKFSRPDEYLHYWKKRVGETTDGTKIAGNQIQEGFIKLMQGKRKEKILDLGCSFGRLCRLLKQRTENVFGMDVGYQVIAEAVKEPYVVAVKGRAEETPFPEGFFHKIVAWAVYDMVEQEKALREAFRILKPGGQLLFTGKNTDYFPDDRLAFVAERNAKLKKFPNHFTDIYLLLANLEKFGFRLRHGFAFLRRGDFGRNKYVDILGQKPKNFYEYLLIVERLEKIIPARKALIICAGHSRAAQGMAKANGFADVVKYFRADQAEERKRR